MYSKFENFLLNSKVNDEIFNGASSKIKIHKEKYDNRFEIIYFKTFEDSIMKQGRYEVGGYYDTKNRCIYELDRRIEDKIPEDSIIKTNTFSKLGVEFLDKLKEHLINYSFEHEEELKAIAKEKYEARDDYRINNFKKEVRRLFLSDNEIKKTLSLSISDYEITNRSDYGYILSKYLDNPKSAIEEYSNKILEKYGEDFGLELFIYYDKIDYMKAIEENKNNSFNDLYLNKKILESIKDLDAQTVNITIKYGDNKLTFKYDYNGLKRDLQNGEPKCTGLYNRGYDQVSDFIKENDSMISSNKHERKGFAFANIESIAFGKKDLYVKESLNKEIDIEEEYDLEK